MGQGMTVLEMCENNEIWGSLLINDREWGKRRKEKDQWMSQEDKNKGDYERQSGREKKCWGLRGEIIDNRKWRSVMWAKCIIYLSTWYFLRSNVIGDTTEIRTKYDFNID